MKLSSDFHYHLSGRSIYSNQLLVIEHNQNYTSSDMISQILYSSIRQVDSRGMLIQGEGLILNCGGKIYSKH